MIATRGLRPECVKVSVEETQGYFATCCSFELKIPGSISDSGVWQMQTADLHTRTLVSQISHLGYPN